MRRAWPWVGRGTSDRRGADEDRTSAGDRSAPDSVRVTDSALRARKAVARTHVEAMRR